jgi:plasmid stabilization system protein ParE
MGLVGSSDGSAESDLIDIWRYSSEQWGEIQADKYLDELDCSIRKLADNPEIGLKRDYVRAGYRVLFVGPAAVCSRDRPLGP